MACSCNRIPCDCSSVPAGCGRPCSKCDLYRMGDKNVWVERGNSSADVNAPGVCMLDTMSDSQVIYVLERDEKAREDLVKVTSDPHLLNFVHTIARLPTQQEDDKLQSDVNRNHAPASIPFYALFRGQPPFAQ